MQLRTTKPIRSIILSVSACARNLTRLSKFRLMAVMVEDFKAIRLNPRTSATQRYTVNYVAPKRMNCHAACK